MLILAPAAAADDTHCNGVMTGDHDNVIVAAGANCTLQSANVRGNVTNYGELLTEDTNIYGNVDGEPGHVRTAISTGTYVGGNVQIRGSLPVGEFGGFFQAQIVGDFQWEENANSLVALDSSIGGNVKAQGNSGGVFLSISGNTIGGNLECKENDPPILDGGNVIGGDDKCPE